MSWIFMAAALYGMGVLALSTDGFHGRFTAVLWTTIASTAAATVLRLAGL